MSASNGSSCFLGFSLQLVLPRLVSVTSTSNRAINPTNKPKLVRMTIKDDKTLYTLRKGYPRLWFFKEILKNYFGIHDRNCNHAMQVFYACHMVISELVFFPSYFYEMYS